jgi:ATP phosphoribosyltransferase regulatory subunit
MPTTAETAARFDRLEAQAQRLVAVFTAAGCEHVAPAIIQPAGLMLDVVGEDLRARSYVFTDQDGVELCLRPDLTVPTCRLYLERHPDARTPARYCYNGPAFRYRPLDAPRGNPREFRQAGIESYAHSDREASDVEVLRLSLDALANAGLVAPRLKIGDVGLISALLGALAIPERWRRRLRLQFWRTESFRAELKRLMGAHDAVAQRLPASLRARLDPADRAGAQAVIARHLEEGGQEVQGSRTLEEVTDGVLAAIEDARSGPLTGEQAALIESAIAVAAPARQAMRRFEAAVRRPGLDLGAAFDTFERRLQMMASAGIDLDRITFAGDFGRKFEYYTGFVFEVEAENLGPGNPVAGGGRYDGLLQLVGAPHAVPAVGAAIYTERLLSVPEAGRT